MNDITRVRHNETRRGSRTIARQPRNIIETQSILYSSIVQLGMNKGEYRILFLFVAFIRM